MGSNILGSIELSWDDRGNLSHCMHSNIPANDYQKADALALAAVLLTGSQLGILPPRYSLKVCDRILDFIEGKTRIPEPIECPLNGGRVELVQRRSTVVCKFHPIILKRGSMEIEEAVSRLLGNLPQYVSSQMIDDIGSFFRTGILIVVHYYLTQTLPIGISRGVFSKRRFKQHKAQYTMLDFNKTIYPHWQGGLNIPEEIFKENLEESRKYLTKMYKELLE